MLSTDKSIVVKPKTVNKEPEELVKITGKVTDEAGMPMAGVSVRLAGTNIGTTTDFDGNYSITVPSSESVLVFSSIGFARKEIIVDGQTVINVTMQEAVSQLDEIVINAGYYNVSERTKTGSISKIDAKTIEKQPVNNPLAAMQGHMAGVNIIQNTGVSGGGYSVQIRGLNSIEGGSEPLYIIDGVPYSSESLESQSLVGTVLPNSPQESIVSPLNAINPLDIESIEVLKDADATAIYGSRGANGVVLITTKKGKAGKTRIGLNSSSSMGEISRFTNLLNTEQYLEMRIEGINNDGFGAFLDNPAFDSFWPDLKVWDQNRYTNWQEELLGGTSYRKSAQLSISGGNAQTQFLVSGGYQNETSVYPGDSKYGKNILSC